MSDYYSRTGVPITSAQWSEGLRTKKRVAETFVPGYWISTVWLGLNHRFGDGPPLIFETMAFPCADDGTVTSWGEVESDRYSTEAEAAEGHQRITDKLALLTVEPARPADAVDPVLASSHGTSTREKKAT